MIAEEVEGGNAELAVVECEFGVLEDLRVEHARTSLQDSELCVLNGALDLEGEALQDHLLKFLQFSMLHCADLVLLMDVQMHLHRLFLPKMAELAHLALGLQLGEKGKYLE